MAEDKQLKEGLGSFLNIGSNKKAIVQKIIKSETEEDGGKKNTSKPKKEKNQVNPSLSNKNSLEAKKTSNKSNIDANSETEKTKQEDKTIKGGKTGPKSSKDPNTVYKQVGARIPEELKNRLKDALRIQLYGKMTQDEFIEQAILDLLKKKRIPENPSKGI